METQLPMSFMQNMLVLYRSTAALPSRLIIYLKSRALSKEHYYGAIFACLKQFVFRNMFIKIRNTGS